METPILINMPVEGHFTLKQCIYSSLAHKERINNLPGSDYHYRTPELDKNKIILNLHKLFKYCINPIYNQFNNIGLTSVYRNKELNKLMKGVEYSQHIYGYAADIVSTDDTPTSEIFNWCVKYLPLYHQIIWEYPEKGDFIKPEFTTSLENNTANFSWIHISFIEGNNFKENSVSSLDPRIHKHYESNDIYRINNFTHRIKEANQDLIEI